MMKTSKILIFLFAATLALPASADTIRVDQLWYRFIQIGGLIDDNETLNTVAIIDDNFLTGAGEESAPVGYFSMTRRLGGVPQNFILADFPDPISVTEEGNMAAEFETGLFQSLGTVSTGGAGTVALLDGNNIENSAGSVALSGGSLFWNLPISGQWEYVLQSTTVTYPVPEIPVPAAIWLFTSGLIGLAGVARRKF